MVIFDEDLKIHVLSDIYAPPDVEHFFTLDLDIKDYTLTPLMALEEIVSPGLLVSFGNYEFYLPADYYILVYADETSQIDSINISDLANLDFPVLAMNGKTDKMVSTVVKVLDYKPEMTFVVPFLNKNQFFCHPIADDVWVSISQHDQYKRIDNLLIGDLMV